jgi:hypothetical protein
MQAENGSQKWLRTAFRWRLKTVVKKVKAALGLRWKGYRYIDLCGKPWESYNILKYRYSKPIDTTLMFIKV